MAFTHREVFPLIARLITRIPTDTSGFVLHRAIITAVLGDPEGAAIVSRARTTAKFSDDRTTASNMIAWFSKRITDGDSPWKAFFDREQRAGAWAYRAKMAVGPPLSADDEVFAIEGDPRLFLHIMRERDPGIARAKRDAARRPDGQLACEACGFVATTNYPGLSGDVCEIHHRLPLSEAAEPVVTRLGDLAVLCANCHRAIHRTAPLLSVEEFQFRYFPAP